LKQSSKSSFVRNHGRSIWIFSAHCLFSSSGTTRITLDSIPAKDSQSSIIKGTLLCKLSYTICAFVGLGFQLMFALGAATGNSATCKNF
jgi:hypothetical protein